MSGSPRGAGGPRLTFRNRGESSVGARVGQHAHFVHGHDVRVLLPLYSFIDRHKFGLHLVGSHCIHMGEKVEHWIGLHEAPLDGGVPVSQSTDWGPHEALFTLWQSLARQSGLTGEMVGPAQRISREEALRMYTINNAKLLFAETKTGSLEPGKLADLAVLSKDYLGVPVEEIGSIVSLLTMVGGKVVYAATPFAELEERVRD